MRLILLFNGKLVLLFQTYNIILYVHAFLFCWHFFLQNMCFLQSVFWLVAATTSCITYKPSPCDLENPSNDAKGEDE